MKKEINPIYLYLKSVLFRCWLLVVSFLAVTSSFGQIICGPGQMVRLNSPDSISIDGIVDPVWAKVSSNVINKVTVADNTVQQGFTAQWKGMWDSKNLYLLVQVKDSTLRPYEGTDSIFNFDAVEVFLDGNNSRTSTYNGTNDFQYLFSYYLGGVKVVGIGPNDPTGTNVSGIRYAIANTSDGYNMEISIPWSTNTTGSTSVPDTLGFDINVDDNSNNLGKRDEQIQWNNSSTEDYNNPQLFAAVPMVDCAPAPPPTPPVITCGNSQFVKLNSPATITIDGNVDTAWSKVSSNVINKVTVADNTVQQGFTAQWKGMWDSKNLYLLVQVKDSALRPYEGTDSVFNFDAVEVFLDGNNSRTPLYNGTNDFQYLFSYYLGGVKVVRKGPNDPAGTDTTGIQYAVVNTSDGYNMEISIPWSTYTTGSASVPDTLGFDINVDDNSHNLGKRDEQIQWNNSSTQDYTDPQLFAAVPMVDCTPAAPPTPPVITCGNSQFVKLNSPATITIDGNVDTAWSKVSSNVINKVTVADNTVQQGFTAQWKGMWDSKNLYLLVQVKDSALRPYEGTDSVFNFDAVEVFLDGNNSRTPLYNGTNDFQYLFSYYLGGVKVVRKGPNDPAGTDTTGIQYAVANTSDGYNMEISIPWSTYTTGSASVPDTLGFDINVDDNSHNLGKRDEQIQWNNSSTQDYTDPQLFAAVPMVDCTPAAPPTPPVITCGNSQFVKLNSPATITIDGNVDTAWSKVSSNVINKVTVADNTVQQGFTAQWKGMWDSKNLYLLVQVKDSALRPYEGTDSVFNFDAVEVFLDGNNSRTPLYNGTNDFQYLFSYYLGGVKVVRKGPNDPAGTDTTGIQYAVANTSDGYNMEISIPWSTYTTGSASVPDTLGFDINVDDNSHNLGKRDEQIQWNNSSTQDYTDPQLFAAVPMVDCTPAVPPTPPVITCGPSQIVKLNSPATITIDGSVDTTWSKVSPNNITHTTVGTLQPGFGAQWKGMWDNNYLYLLVQVKDSTLRPYEGTDSVFNFDAVEVFLDGNNSRTSTYNGTNDFQYLFSYYLGGVKVIRKGPNDPAGTDTSNIIYSVQNATGGYNIEIRIPWSTYTTGSASRPDTLGFDINVDDNANNIGKRNAQLQWNNSSTQDYNDPQLFGITPLVDCNPAPLTITEGPNPPGPNPPGPIVIIHPPAGDGNCTYRVTYTPLTGNGAPVTITSKSLIDTFHLPGGIASLHTITVLDSCTMVIVTDTFPGPPAITEGPNPPGPNPPGPIVIIHPPAGDSNCTYRVTYTPLTGNGVPVIITSKSLIDTFHLPGGIASLHTITVLDSCTMVIITDTFPGPPAITEGPNPPGPNPPGPIVIIHPPAGDSNCTYRVTYTPLTGNGAPITITSKSLIDTFHLPGGIASLHTITVLDSCTMVIITDTFPGPPAITEGPNPPGPNPPGPIVIIHPPAGDSNCTYRVTYTPLTGNGVPVIITSKSLIDTFHLPGGIASLHTITVLDSCTMVIVTDTFPGPPAITEGPNPPGPNPPGPIVIIHPPAGDSNCTYRVTYTPLTGNGAPVTITSKSLIDTFHLPGGIASLHTITVLDSCTMVIVTDTFPGPPTITEGPYPPGPNPPGPIVIIHPPAGDSNCTYSVTYTPLNNNGAPVTITSKSLIDTFHLPGGIASLHTITVLDSCTMAIVTDTFHVPLRITSCVLTDTTIRVTITNGNTGPYTITYTPVDSNSVTYNSILSVDSIRLPLSIASKYTLQVIDSSTLQSVIGTFYVQPKLSITDSLLSDTTIQLKISGGNRYTCSNIGDPPITNQPTTSGPNDSCIYTVIYTPSEGGAPIIKSGKSLNNTMLTVPAGIASSYTLQIIDSCTFEHTIDSINIGPQGPLTLANVGSTNATCNGNDGTITVKANGGKFPYTFTYTFNGGAPMPSPLKSTIVGLVPGNYTVSVTDANSTTATISVVIGALQQHLLKWKF